MATPPTRNPPPGQAASPQPTPSLFPRGAGLIGLLLFLAVLGVFLPAIRNDFVGFDDQDYVTANARIQRGLTWENISWAFRSTEGANWHPLTWLSHMADCQIFGLAPWGHHLTSVLLHACNTLLVFLVFRKMTGTSGRSLFVAALFGLHPLHVESVAWVAERKDVLSTLFFLLTVWTYADWTKRSESPGAKTRISYGLTFCFFALGLMCKPMLVTLPFILLLLDYWPLNRTGSSAESSIKTAFRLWREKLPFFGLSLAAGIATLVAQEEGGAFHAMANLPYLARLANALVSFCRYLGKFLYPVNLAIFYQHPGTWPAMSVVTAGAALLGLTLLAVAFRKRHPYLLVGWLWFIITLGPVIGLVQVGMQAMADRYTYIPSLGIFLLLAWGVHDLTSRCRHQTIGLRAAATISLIGCAILTNRQIGFWANSETLFRHATAVTENNWVMQNNLGQILLDIPGRSPEAIEHFEAALQSKPDYAEAHNNLGNALTTVPGRSAEAIAQFQAALELVPNFAEAHNNLGNALANLAGRSAVAIAEYETALRLKPDYADAHNNLGNALAKIPDRLPEAITHLQAAVRLRPDYAEAHFNLGNALASLPGRLPEALAEYESALRIKPRYAEAHFNFGNALARQPDRLPDAIAQYQAALKFRPDYAEAHNNLGAALARLPDRMPEAITHFEAALRLKPGLVNAHFNLGAALMRIPGQEPRAISEFEAILRTRPDFEPARQMLEQLRTTQH